MSIKYIFDLRSLAASRICLAFLFIVDIVIRLTDLSAHYTDAGVLPTSELYIHHWHPLYFSFHNIHSGSWFQIIVFSIGIIIGLGLLAGYKTSLASFLCWVFLISLHNRNFYILQGGDDLLRMAMFWGIFLPWGQRFSLFKNKPTLLSDQIYSFAGLALMIQLASVYFFSALMKTGPEWHQEGTALYYALNLDQVSLPGGIWLRQFENVLPYLTWLTYYIELLSPILLFIPFSNQWFRLISISTLIVFHVLSGVTLFIGLFPYIGIACLTALVPSMVWNKFNQRSESPTFQKFSLLQQMIMSLVVLFCFAWNVGNLSQFPYRMNSTMRLPASLLRFDQSWGMFAPGVFKDDGWYVMKGITLSKKEIDINREGKPIDPSKPDYVLAHIKNDRWRKFQEFIIMIQHAHLRSNYCKFLKSEWNNTHPTQQINTLEIIYFMEFTTPPQTKSTIEPRKLCNC